MAKKPKTYSQKNIGTFDAKKLIRVFYELAKFGVDKNRNIFNDYLSWVAHREDDLIQRLVKETTKTTNSPSKRQYDIYLATLERLLDLSINEAEFLSSKDKTSLTTKKLKIDVLLDQVRSAHNVGAIFRNAECFGVNKLLLNFPTVTPEHPSVQKTAMGCEKYVQWEELDNPLKTIDSYREMGYQIIALELNEKAININDLELENKECGVLLILGHEQYGVSNEILKTCDKIVKIPLRGIKNSLNVACSSAIALQILTSKMSGKIHRT